MSMYHLAVTVHLLAAMLWLGGVFSIALVAAPALRGVEPAVRSEVFRRMGYAFRRVGWVALATLLATGVWLLNLRGLLHPDVLLEPAFWSGQLGRTLGQKLLLVAAIVGIAAVHDFVIGPRSGDGPG